MTKQERKDYARLRKAIHAGVADMAKRSFEVGEALLEIQGRKLYRAEHKTFQKYCEVELEIARSRAYELLKAAEVKRELSATADIVTLPANERQIRPLTTLKTADLRVAAWSRALGFAGTKPVSEADVRKAVKELTPKAPALQPTVPLPTWSSAVINHLISAGFERAFEQPIKWRVDAVHLHAPEAKRYIRLIERLMLEDVACAKALKDAGIDCIFLTSADANSKEGLIYATNGTDIVESFSPEFEVLAEEIGLYIEDDGIFYHQGDLDEKYQAAWTPLTPAELDSEGLPSLSGISGESAGSESREAATGGGGDPQSEGEDLEAVARRLGSGATTTT